MKNKAKVITGLLYCFLLVTQAFAADDFAQGRELFRRNKPVEALPLLTASSLEENPDPLVFNYLGLTYAQLRQFDAAVTAFIRGAELEGADSALLFFNAGNAAFSAGNFAEASDLYTKSYEANPSYAKAVLNRANAELRQLHLEKAYDDYELYLLLDPSAAQKTQIQQLITLLKTDIQTEQAISISRQAQDDALRQQAEAQKRVDDARSQAEAFARQNEENMQKVVDDAKMQADADAQRKIAEARAKAESQTEQARIAAQKNAEKTQAEIERQRLLDQISSSLKSSDSTNISAGSEGVLDYTHVPGLE